MNDDFTLTSPVPVGGRESHDHYPTPRWCTELLFEHAYKVSDGYWPTVRSVLDPAAGEGAILDVARERGFSTYGLELDLVRAEAARARGHQMGTGDALECSWPRVDVVVANPPYTLAEAFVRKALEWRHCRMSECRIYTLLRLSFLEPTSTRRELLGAYCPNVLILPRRPAFDGRGTDSITSAWLCWPGRGQLVWLPP